MMNKRYKIPTWSPSKGWTYTKFPDKETFRVFVKSLFKEPGLYPMDETIEQWNIHSRKFDKDKLFCEAPEGSRDYQEYWDTEKEKCRKGVIYHNDKGDTWYLPRFYYHWLNFLQIYNKSVGKFTFPEVRDVQYHMGLYEVLAELFEVDASTLKARQKASSYFHLCKMYNKYLFEEGYVGKVLASNKDFMIQPNGSWKFLDHYHNFNNSHTAWSCINSPDKPLEWQQKVETKTADGRKVKIGLMSTIVGITLNQSPTAGVGGATSECFYEEGGIAPTADQTHIYMKSAMREGGIVSGIFSIAGSVGKLTDCNPLKEFTRNPIGNGFYPVWSNLLDKNGKEGWSGLFIPEHWGMPPYIDKYGRSMVKEALEYLEKEDNEWKNGYTDERGEKVPPMKPDLYQIQRSQRPRNIEEAFAIRTVSVFPAKHTSRQIKRIEDGEVYLKYIDLERGDNGEIIAKKAEREPVPYNTSASATMTMADKRGCIVIHQHPGKNPEWMTYFWSADPVETGQAEFVDNMIYTPNGKKRIGDIQIGENIIGSDGKSIEVTGVFPQGLRKLYRVTFSDRSSVLVDENHLWSVELNGGTRGNIVLSTKQLINKEEYIILKGKDKNWWKDYKFKTHYKRPNGVMRWKIPMVLPIEFKSEEVPIDAYVIGSLLGDGGITHKSIRFTTADKESIITLQNLLEYQHEIIKVKNSKYDYYIRKPKGVYINYISKQLKLLKLRGLKSSQKFIPDIYKYASIEDRISLLQGLMDTDGYCGKTETKFYTTSERLAEDIIELVQSLGGTAWKELKTKSGYLPEHKGVKKYKTSAIYDVEINIPYPINPFRLSRKANKYKYPTKYPPCRYIKSIEFEKEGEALCISVDVDDKLYVTENAIVTHNTSSSESLAAIYIYMNPVEVTRIDAEGNSKTFIEGDKLVAEWVGRYDDVNETNEQMSLLIEYYNAYGVSEKNKPSLNTYMQLKKRMRHLAPSNEMLTDAESGDTIGKRFGWHNTAGTWRKILQYGVDSISEELEEETDEAGNITKIRYGVERIPFIWLLKEMQSYEAGKNYDRIIAFCALMTFAKLRQAEIAMRQRTERSESAPIEQARPMTQNFLRSIGRQQRGIPGRVSGSPFRSIGMGKPKSK